MFGGRSVSASLAPALANLLAGVRSGDCSSSRGGVVISVRHAFLRPFAKLQHSVLVAGRASILRLVRPSGGTLIVIGVDLDLVLSMPAKGRFLGRVRTQFNEHREQVMFIVGDWNFLGAEDLRVKMGVEAAGAIHSPESATRSSGTSRSPTRPLGARARAA